MATAAVDKALEKSIVDAIREVVPGFEADDLVEFWRNRMPEPDAVLTLEELAGRIALAIAPR